MNYVRVKFYSAKLPFSDKFSGKSNRDFVYDKLIQGERPESELITSADDAIRFEPICNMLHVLFGERPVSTLRGNGFRKLSDEITEIAKNGYIKIDSLYSYVDSKGNTNAIVESTQGKKLPPDSNSKFKTKIGDTCMNGWITWDSLKRMLMYDEEKYNDILSHLEEYSGIKNIANKRPMSLFDCLKLIKESASSDEAAKYFESKGMTPISNYIIDGVADFSSLSKHSRKLAAVLYHMYVRKKITLSGDFLFPVTDEQYNNLVKHSGFATYLDNGIARLETRLIDVPYYELEDYTKIKDLKGLCE